MTKLMAFSKVLSIVARAPTIMALTPNIDSAGTAISLTGTNLTDAALVTDRMLR
ncbi:MAG: hypothetical protein U0412_05285 [Nitrospira sp.]